MTNNDIIEIPVRTVPEIIVMPAPTCVLCDEKVRDKNDRVEFIDSVLGCEYDVHKDCADDKQKRYEFNYRIGLYVYGDE